MLRTADRSAVAVRPEKIQIDTAAGDREGENSFAGHVVEVGYLGGVSVYRIKLDNGLEMKATVANRAPRRAAPPAASAIGSG